MQSLEDLLCSFSNCRDDKGLPHIIGYATASSATVMFRDDNRSYPEDAVAYEAISNSLDACQ